MPQETPVTTHITVNGTPFCEWNGCAAHREKSAKVGLFYCAPGDDGEALRAAKNLTAQGVKGVAVAIGPCPVGEKLKAERRGE
jgi:hypothetical protein